MNINSDNFRYKQIAKIEPVGKALRGEIFKFYFNSENVNPPELFNANDIIDYYDYMGEPVEDYVKNIKVGDYLIQHK